LEGPISITRIGLLRRKPVSPFNPMTAKRHGPRIILVSRRTNSSRIRPTAVGQISAIEVQTVAGDSLEFFVIYFAKSKMKVRVPTRKAASVGMRRLSDPATIAHVRRSLGQAALKARANWPRMIKECEAKIKSGDLVAMAEVMRDLYRRSTDSEQNYTERQLYAAALDRISGEVALVENISEENTVLELESLLMSRSGRKI